MKRIALRWSLRILRTLVNGTIGAAIVLIIGFVVYLDNRADLKIWHDADLDAEFTEDSPVDSFSGYLELEDRLFKQLQTLVIDRIEAVDRQPVNRFFPGSLSSPRRWPHDWNRSFEFATENPRAGVLLLHGLSDSPYSLRALGLELHRAGAWVTALRLPGHGTAPCGLVEVRWQDMAAAVRLAMRHVKSRVGDRPVYILGYSTGGALAVHYAATALDRPDLPKPGRLVLISPAVGVTPLAAFAVWQARLGHLLGLDKLAWNEILPEYDPFKYNSFAVNAGDQVYRLTEAIRTELARLATAGSLDRFPPVLAFQSVVDDTVSTPALMQELFGKLPPGGHELVLFDINRKTDIEPLLSVDPGLAILALLKKPAPTYRLTLITNTDEDSAWVVSLQPRPEGGTPESSPLNLFWPAPTYSLSHVALPFPADDPLYGVEEVEQDPWIHLGNLALRGEKGVLRIPASNILRQRWNPFYDYLQQRTLAFLGLDGDW